MIVKLTLEDAVEAGALIAITKPHGPSMGDRCCLALGRRLALPVVHAERRRQRLPDGIGVERVLVRGRRARTR